MIEAKFTVEPGDFVLDIGDNREEVGANHYLQRILESSEQVQRLLQVVRDPIRWLGRNHRRVCRGSLRLAAARWIRCLVFPCSRSHVTVQT